MKKLLFLFMLTIGAIINAQAGGDLDTTFNPGIGANNGVFRIAQQSDGKTLIGGSFTSYNGTSINKIARLNTDGSLDTTFNPGTTGANSSVQSIALQSDGKILIGGQFTTYNSTAINRIARLNADGSLDTSFNVGTGANKDVSSIAIQSDGKILIVGDFTSYNGTSIYKIARLNTDGSLDATFNPGSGSDSKIFEIALQSDGKILIGGDFIFYNGTAKNRIARLNADGSLDPSFNVGIGANSVVISIALQSDGKILIGGVFHDYNGTAVNRIARLNADGSLDMTFNPGTAGANSSVQSIAIQSDGKILIGGQFTTYNYAPINRIARLNADGSLDFSFNVGTGANNYVYRIAIQSDGKILIVGAFTSYNGIGRNIIARLFSRNLSVSSSIKKEFQIYPNPVKETLFINSKEQISAYEIYSLDGKKVSGNKKENTTQIDVSKLSVGNYILKLKTKNGEETVKFIKN